jgi:hypothetical protein
MVGRISFLLLMLVSAVCVAEPTTQPTFITLHVTDADPKTVLAEIVKQSHADIEAWPQDLWNGQHNTKAKISLNMDHEPFWQAMGEFGAASQTSPQQSNGRGPPSAILICQGGCDPKFGGIMKQFGMYTVVATSISHNLSTQLGRTTTDRNNYLYLEVYADPKVYLVGFGPAKLDVASDENGMSLVDSRQSLDGGMNFNAFCTWQFNLNVSINFPDHYGQKLKRASGVFRATVASQIDELKFDDLSKSVGAKTTAGNHTVQIRSFDFQGDHGSLAFHVTRTASAVTAGGNMFGELNNVQIIDAAGKRMGMGGSQGTAAQDWVDWSVSFNSDGPAKLPLSFVWDVVGQTQTIDQPFEFDDLVLPQE